MNLCTMMHKLKFIKKNPFPVCVHAKSDWTENILKPTSGQDGSINMKKYSISCAVCMLLLLDVT